MNVSGLFSIKTKQKYASSNNFRGHDEIIEYEITEWDDKLKKPGQGSGYAISLFPGSVDLKVR